MNDPFLTLLIPFDSARQQQVRACLDSDCNPLRGEWRDKLDRLETVHFMSLGVVPAEPGQQAYLYLEAATDETPRSGLGQIVQALGNLLPRVLTAAGRGERADEDLANYLWQYRRKTGQTITCSTLGLDFWGTPGMSVRRINLEASLAQKALELLDKQENWTSARDRLAAVRQSLWEEGQWKWAFFAGEKAERALQANDLKSFGTLLKHTIFDLLWPLLLVAVVIGWWLWPTYGFFTVAIIVVDVLIGTLVAIMWLLLRKEAADQTADPAPDPEALDAITARENQYLDIQGMQSQCVQNHMFAVSTIKPGLIRRVTLTFGLWAVGTLYRLFGEPGYLADIGTIHFARWVVLPERDRLLFFSNYDGTWQSYLEDFIEKAHLGLTAIWSNTAHFPRTYRLIRGGAADGERFKRWARRQQLPTLFWYSAYAGLSAGQIRRHAAVRAGLSAPLTETAARDWLALFGSEVRPRTVEEGLVPSLLARLPKPEPLTRLDPSRSDALQCDELPALLLPGFRHLTESACVAVRFHDNMENCRRFVAAVYESLSFGDRPRPAEVTLIAFTASGLDKWKLPLERFPAAFRQGMSHATRARILGDAPDAWSWGNQASRVDAVLLVYGRSAEQLQRRLAELADLVKVHNHDLVKTIHTKLRPAERLTIEKDGALAFKDTLSQPRIRGLRRGAKAVSPADIVAPGEFILGYPDNRGRCPPTVLFDPLVDPVGVLPAASVHYGGMAEARPPLNKPTDLDFGLDGTFLVIRQLEFDVEAFNRCLNDNAKILERHPIYAGLRSSVSVATEWMAAKMVGRWPNGCTLLDAPFATKPDAGSDNAFRFGRDDAQGLACPLGAHIRRANPRDSFKTGGSNAELAVSNRHRILRFGRPYENDDKRAKPGLLFICANADIERQFEFIQSTWMMNRSFHGLGGEVDPVIGAARAATFTIPTSDGPLRLSGLQQFTTMLGGGYFFLPGRTAVRYLATPRY